MVSEGETPGRIIKRNPPDGLYRTENVAPAGVAVFKHIPPGVRPQISPGSYRVKDRGGHILPPQAYHLGREAGRNWDPRPHPDRIHYL